LPRHLGRPARPPMKVPTPTNQQPAPRKDQSHVRLPQGLPRRMVVVRVVGGGTTMGTTMGDGSQDDSQARRIFKDAYYYLYLVLLVLRD
jgi:hypothetical protein